MRSDLVVISWWSNCLGLACLHRLVQYTRNRRIYAVQVGKPEEQKEHFRACLPPGVEELPYGPDRPGEDWRVREAVARELLAEREGVWFVDHDLFFQEEIEPWLTEMDRRFAASSVCLCHPLPRHGPSITNPAFWLSPVRFPAEMPGFARLPYREEPVASRPYAVRQSAVLMMPEKDTLVAAMEFLQGLGLVNGFPLTEADRWPGGPPPLPCCNHLGGLYTFTGKLSPELYGWVARCVERFIAFYAGCPAGWVAIEDPVLLARLEEFSKALPTARGDRGNAEVEGLVP